MNEYSIEEIKFLRDNYATMSISDIANKLNRPYGSVFMKARRIGLTKYGCKNNEWSDAEIEFLKDNWKNLSTKELANQLGRTEKAVHVKKSKLGLKGDPVYKYDRNKFSSICTEEDAYWLGFLYADGYVCESNSSYWFGVELQYRDIEHLEKLNKFMDSDMHIDTFFKKSPCSDNMCKMCKLCFYSKKLFNNLVKCGCVQRKSKIIKMPFDVVPDGLMRHFIRGYFDGDGSCGIYKHSDRKYLMYPSAKIACGSRDFVVQLKDYLTLHEIKCGIVNDNGCYDIFFKGKNNVPKFLDYMYNNSTIYLNRKYKIYKKCLDIQ